MSDTQSSEEQQIRVQQKMEAKLRDLLDRAKKITPFYEDETLLLIYKDCFHTDHVFINKLEIIAKSHKSTQQEEDQDWIQFKQQQKTVAKASQDGEHTKIREKYNFLADAKLLKRAQQFNLAQERELWLRRKEELGQKYQNKFKSSNQNKPKYQQKKQDQDVQQEKKIKYKQKVEQSATLSNKNSPSNQSQVPQVSQVPQLHQEASPKPALKYKQKKQIYVEKKVENPVQTISENKKQADSTKTQILENKKEQKPPKIKYQKKVSKIRYQEKIQKVEPNVKKLQKIQEKQKTQLPQVIANKPIEQKVNQPPIKRVVSQKELDPIVKRQFETNCQSNSFILKFILPTSKLQKISYIRDPNGSYRQVKTRQPLSK